MDNHELKKLIHDISMKYFNKPFVDQALFNHRLRTTGGRYIPSRRTIEINKKYLDELGYDEVIGIIKHELCHYYLHIEGKPFNHGSREFKELLKQTGSPRYCKILPSVESQYMLYICRECGMLYKRKRKLNIRRYRCGKCRGQIQLKSFS